MNNDSLEIYICATYVPTEIIIIVDNLWVLIFLC